MTFQDQNYSLRGISLHTVYLFFQITQLFLYFRVQLIMLITFKTYTTHIKLFSNINFMFIPYTINSYLLMSLRSYIHGKDNLEFHPRYYLNTVLMFLEILVVLSIVSDCLARLLHNCLILWLLIQLFLTTCLDKWNNFSRTKIEP